MATNNQKNNKRSPKSCRSKYDPDCFLLPHPAYMVGIPLAIVYLFVATFAPESIPEYLGPLADLGQFLSQDYSNLLLFLCAVVVVLHVGEALYAWKVCWDRKMNGPATAKWVVSTLLFGFSSLVLKLLPLPSNQRCA